MTAKPKPPVITSLRPYVPSSTARKFHASNKLVRGVMGPVGSGKSVMCVMELFSRSLEQEPDENGIRKTRYVIIRNTFPQLTTTSLKTVMEWLPPGIMNYTLASPIRGVMDHLLVDGTRVQSEWLFIALDVEADIARLKSVDATMVWINEAAEIPKAILDIATTRCGRYPSVENDPKTGEQIKGPTFQGLIWDSNPPDDSHWIYLLGEKKKPEEFIMWKQPPGLIKVPAKKEGEPPTYIPNDGTHPQCSEPAENIDHLSGGYNYYLRAVNSGKDDEWIKVFVMGQYGSTMTGKPVFSEYNDSVHLAKENLVPYRGMPLLLGWDFGLNASCVFAQLSPTGVLNVIDELTSESMGIQRFVREMVRPRLTEKYHDLKIIGTGDPAGTQRSQTTEVTCFQILAEEGLDVSPALTNEFVARRESVAYFLTKMANGKPAFQLSPNCDVLRKGFLGNYAYRRMKISGSERFTDRPDKNLFSHLQDALQYAALYFRDMGSAGTGFFGGKRNERRNVKPTDMRGWT